MDLCRDESRSKSQPVADRFAETKAASESISFAGFCSFSRSFAGFENTAEDTGNGFPRRCGFSRGFTGGENTVESAGSSFPGHGFARSFACGENTEDAGNSFSFRITHGDAKAQEAIAFPSHLCRQRHPDAETGGIGDSGGKACEDKEMGDTLGRGA